MEFLQDFDFVLDHIPGHSNTVADLLSRRKDLNKGVDSQTRILLSPSLFLCKVYLEDNLDKRRTILQELHSLPSAGHPGIANTWALVNRHYEGPRLRAFVEQYVRGCPYCQESKTNIPRKKAPLQCFDTHVDQGPFQYVSMDLITDLPVSEGYDSILTIVDQGCSKATKFLPCRKTIDGPEVARLYLVHLVPLFGLPKRIISDRDPCFASQFATTLCKALGIQQNLSTAFHPRTNGQTERMNAWLEQYLRPWCVSHPRGWVQLLPIAEYAHNSWKHDTLKQTPHELITGMTPSVNIDLIPDHIPAAQERLQTLQRTRAELQERLDRLQKVKDNKSPPQLTVGQRVWLEGCNLHIRGPAKLLPKHYGPFPITQKIGSVAYQLQLPPLIKVHDMFHIDLLTPYKETEEYGQAYTRPPPITVQSEEEYEVDSILQARRKTPGDSIKYKVHWKGYPSADDSWVPHEDLHSPDLLKEFYAQGGKVQTVKRRRERLRRLILSLSCLPSTTTPLLTDRPRSPPQTKRLFDKSNELQYTLRTLCGPSRCSTRATRPMIATKNETDVDSSFAWRYKCSATTVRPEMRLRTSSTPPPGQSAVVSSSQDKTTKPRRLLEERSFTGSYKSWGTTPTSTPSTIRATPLAACLRQTSTSYSSSETQRCPFKTSIFSVHRGQLRRTNHIQGRHLPTLTISHTRRPLKSSKNSESCLGRIGTAVSKGCPHSTTTLSRDWEEARFKLPSIHTISSRTTRSSSFQGGVIAPVTRAPSEHEKIPIPGESSRAKRHTPSFLERLSRRWWTSPSSKNGTKPSARRYSASAKPMIMSETWPRTWPTSRNYTTTHAGKNRTRYELLREPMPSAASSHVSFTTPRRPRTFLGPCSMLALTILPMGGSTAQSSTTSDASGAKGADTLRATAPGSINVCYVTGTDTKSSTAEPLTSDVKQEEYAASPMTTPGWPTPIARQMSGPSDDGKDTNKGVMSRETSHT
jgi:integrase-like protein/chromodomain-containing protein